ncbi:MAG: hypothetical protein H6Q70_3618 [Firmicutes bacterium]|nr:hypothetical protein [Bacillota bacterium]
MKKTTSKEKLAGKPKEPCKQTDVQVTTDDEASAEVNILVPPSNLGDLVEGNDSLSVQPYPSRGSGCPTKCVGKWLCPNRN